MSKQYQGAIKTLDSQIQKFKVAESDARIIEGYFTTTAVDRGGDISLTSAFEKTLGVYMQNPILTYMHSIKDVIGKVLEYRVDDAGIWIKAQIAKGVKLADEVWALIEQGMIKGFSYGYKTLLEEPGTLDGKKVTYLKEVDLYEIAVVSLPMNGTALFSLGADGAVKSVTMKIETKLGKTDEEVIDVEAEEVETKEITPNSTNEVKKEHTEEGESMTLDEVKQVIQEGIKEALPQIANAVVTAIKEREDAESEAIIKNIEESKRQETEQNSKAVQAAIKDITTQLKEIVASVTKKEEK